MVRTSRVKGASAGSDPHVFVLESASLPYRLMVESMAEGALTLMSDGVILYCNRRFTEMIGRELDGVIGARAKDFVAPADAPRFKRLIEAAYAAPANGRINLQSADGSLVPASLAARNFGTRAVPQYLVMVSDLTAIAATERHAVLLNAEIEKQLGEVQRAEKRYQELVETITDGLLVVNDTLTITSCNPQFARMIGYAASDLLGHGVQEFIAERQRHLVQPKIKLQNGEMTSRRDLDWRRKDGTIAKTLVSARPIVDRNRRYRGFTYLVTDWSKGHQDPAPAPEAEGQASKIGDGSR